MNAEILTICFKLILLLTVPITVIILAVSLVSASLLSYIKGGEHAVMYTIKLIALVVGILVITTSSYPYFISEVQRLLTQ